MIQYLEDLPSNIVGFRAVGDVTGRDFEDTVMPRVKSFLTTTDKLNYLLVLDTSLKNFSFEAWVKDFILGIKHFSKWNRIAIVTDVTAIRRFTDVHTFLMPGQYRGFEHKDLNKAIRWISEKPKTAIILNSASENTESI